MHPSLLATKLASKRHDQRSYLLAAVGVRADGTRVASANGPAFNKCWRAHAEARLLRKLDVGSEVWVARVTRTGALAMAKPCAFCALALKQRGVKKIWFTNRDGEWEAA